jgi:hypothetical protein
MNFQVISVISPKEIEFVLFLVSIFTFFLMSLLKVKLAWGGLIFSVIGYYILPKKSRSIRGIFEISPFNKSRIPKTSFRGPIALAVVIGGVVIAIVDLAINGPDAVAEARETAKKIANPTRLEDSEELETLQDITLNCNMFLKDLRKTATDFHQTCIQKKNTEQEDSSCESLTKLEALFEKHIGSKCMYNWETIEKEISRILETESKKIPASKSKEYVNRIDELFKKGHLPNH